jgi:antitoxin (DNA-binding transcriptional repressor) of toxin-antitoxin stability system
MSSPAALAPRRLHPRGSRRPVALAAVLGGALLTSAIADAQACGCLVLSDVSVPTVQAGERILFAQDNGTVTAIIQIQYQGKPGDFGWLVPLPAIPQNRLGQDGIDVSTDELFTQLLKTTGPTYTLTSTSTCTRGLGGGGGYGGGYGGGFGCNSASLSGSANEAAYGAADLGSAPPPPPSPLVVQSSVGPYDFAVLKADSQADMLKWLQDNRYVVPTGSDAAVSPYVRPGAYFLALKLRADQNSGDVQPIVLRYKSDYPMVPLTLTSVGAVPNMGIQVWVLGSARAIPRNFYHAVLNDAQLDLLNNVGNYSQVVTAAVAEAPRKHAFITEYAGSSNVMAGTLNRPGRFDRVTELPAVSDPYQYVQMALNPLFGFTPVPNYGELALQQSAAALATVLAKYIPEPQSLVARGIPLLTYYQSLDYYLRRDPQRGGPDYDAVALKLQMFDPRAATADLQSRIVIPNKEAQQLFDTHGQLTRLYTTISPEDMNVDPVFGFNPELPAVPLAHRASLAQGCEPYDRTLDTDSGIHVSSWTPADRQLPYSLRIETIGEVGQPVVITNNGTKIRSLSPLDRDPNADPSGAELQRGCVTTPGRRLPVAAPVSLIVLCSGLVVLRRRRRAPASA